MRFTITLGIVLAVLGRNPGQPMYGLEIIRDAKLKSGTVYPILQRMVEHGWCEATWEDPDLALAQKRTRRRYYTLTTLGAAQAAQAMTLHVGGNRYKLVPVGPPARQLRTRAARC